MSTSLSFSGLFLTYVYVILDGFVMIQAWAYEQGEHSKRVFHEQDTMVPWQLNKRFVMQSQSNGIKGEEGTTVHNNNDR